MISTLLIDDEPLAVKLLKEYLSAHTDFNVAAECYNGLDGLKAIQEHKPELIFLDIQMPKISGFEMLELLDHPPAVIFTTAFDEYAIKAFEKNAVDYLLKPFSKERFDNALERFRQQRSANRQDALRTAVEEATGACNRVVVKVGNNIRIIPVQDIHYLAADDDYVCIHTANETFLKNKTLQYFERTLNPKQFVRVHRSYIVQVSQITRIEAFEKESHLLILQSGQRIPVSKTGYPKLKTVLGI